MNIKKMINKIALSFVVAITILTYRNVDAASASISANRTTITLGESATITVYYNAETWNLHLSGSISDSEVGYSMNGPQNGSRSWTFTPSSTGSFTISLSGDVSDDNGTFNAGGSVTITVNPKPAPQPDPTPSPTPNTPSTPSTPSNPKPGVSPVTDGEDTRSGNTNLSSLTVENYNLSTEDNVHYTLSVPHSVESVKIKATVEDSKSKVTGDGAVSLKVGENNFDIVVTAENGTTKTYSVKITRKDIKYAFSDFQDALKDTDKVVVVLEEKDIISKSMLEQLQKAKKSIRFARYKEDGKELYSWIIDGNKLKNLQDFNPNISFKMDKEDDFDQKAGYRKGMYLQFLEKKGFPKGISLVLNVSDYFKDKDNIYLYSYDNDIIKKIGKALTVTDGFVTFTAKDLSNNFLSKAIIGEKVNNESNIYKIISAFEFVCLFFLVCFLVLTRTKKKKNDSAVQTTV